MESEPAVLKEIPPPCYYPYYFVVLYDYEQFAVFFVVAEFREVNPYKKVDTFASFFCVHSSIKVSTFFFFISDDHIFKQ